MTLSEHKEIDGMVFERIKNGFIELRPLFERLKDGSCPDDFVFPLKSWRESKGIPNQLRILIKKSGVPIWPRLFSNLRSSCIMDYDEMGFGQKTLDSIFGNSQEVRRKHYIGFRRDREFMKIINSNIPIVELLSSLGGTFENGMSYDNNIDAIISRLSSLKTSLVLNSPEIPIHDRSDDVCKVVKNGNISPN